MILFNVLKNYLFLDDLDFFEIEDYGGMLKSGKKIVDAIQLEVM